jgi:hypothetical protein
MRRKLSADEIADQQRGSVRLGPGLWRDRHGDLHVSVVELLEAFDLEDTPENRARVEQIAEEQLCRPLGATVIRQEPE